jgi:nitric oxide reductase activation protein
MIGYAWDKIKGTMSGWERSHFGGFYRMISDYPYIKLDYDIKIELDDALTKQLSWYNAEKLIKLYLLKAQSISLTGAFRQSQDVVVNKWSGSETKVIITYLDNTMVFDELIDSLPEFAPLFEHYKQGIFKSYLVKEVKDDEQQGGSEGSSDDQEQEGSSEQEQSGEQEGSSKQIEAAMQKMREQLSDIKEHAPWKTKDSLCNFDSTPKFMQPNPHNYTTDYKFSKEEIKDAENLIKMLDISFDPKEDVVKSLRAGKLDVCKIAEVPAGSTSIYKQTVEDQDTKPFGVCILADLSGSMTCSNRLDMQKHVLNVLYLAMSQTVTPDKLWIYGHTGDEEAEIHPFYTPYDTDYEKNILNYNRIEYAQNYDGPVIEAIHKKIREVSEDRIIFISLSDGQPSGNGYGSDEDVDDMKKILERARRDDFVTIGIGIQYLCVDGLYTYHKVVDDLSTLVKDVSHIVNKVVMTEFK